MFSAVKHLSTSVEQFILKYSFPSLSRRGGLHEMQDGVVPILLKSFSFDLWGLNFQLCAFEFYLLP
jgi:phage-related protein